MNIEKTRDERSRTTRYLITIPDRDYLNDPKAHALACTLDQLILDQIFSSVEPPKKTPVPTFCHIEMCEHYQADCPAKCHHPDYKGK